MATSTTVLKHLDLALGILVYFCSSLGGVAVVKFLNYRFCFTSWLVFALLSRATWLLAFPLHVILQLFHGAFSRTTTGRQLRLYVLIAMGLSVVELFNSLSMTVLPGAVYALLKGTDVGWSMVLSWWWLHKKYNIHQVVAAILIMGGVSLVFVLGGPPAPSELHAFATEEAMRSTHVNVPAAAVLCVMGAFFNALCSVVTEATLKQSLKEEEDLLLQDKTKLAPSKLQLSNSYSMYTSLFSFGIIGSIVGVQMLLSLEEEDHGLTTGMNFSCEQAGAAMEITTAASSAVAVACFLLVLVTLTRFSERLSKHYICVRDSAMTFSVVQAGRRLSGVFLLALMFQESLPVSMLIGTACSAVGFALHWYGGSQIQQNSGKHVDGKGNTYELVPTAADRPADASAVAV